MSVVSIEDYRPPTQDGYGVSHPEQYDDGYRYLCVGCISRELMDNAAQCADLVVAANLRDLAERLHKATCGDAP